MLVDAGGAERAPAGARGDFAAFEVAEEFFPFGVGGGAVFLGWPQCAAAGQEGQVGLDRLVGVDGFVAEGDVDVAVPGDDLGDVRREAVHDGVGEEHPAEVVGGVVQRGANGVGQCGAGQGAGEDLADGGGGDRAVLGADTPNASVEGRQLLQLPGSLAHHGNQLASRICAAAGRRQQLRRPRPGRDVERHQGPVPVRVQGREDLIEVLIRDAARDPRRHRRPVHAAALEVIRLHRIAMRMSPPAPPGPIQRERVDQRAGARLQVEVIKAAQHRLAMRPHRRRIHLARYRNRRIRPRPALLAPVRPHRLPGQLQPPAEIPGLGPARPVPGHPRCPQEPEPAQQIHPIRAEGRLRPPRRLQVTEIRPGGTDGFPVRGD